MRPIQQGFAWFSVYGAVAPTTGERFFWERPERRSDMCQRFLEACAHVFPDRLTILLLDHSGAPTAQRLRWPEKVRYVWLPPYAPALHPIERVWRDVKADLAWCQFAALEAQQKKVGDW